MCLTDSALVGASEVGAIDDLEELHDLGAAELRRVGPQADAVQGCRVAERLRVNGDAEQNRDEELKTQSLLVAKT